MFHRLRLPSAVPMVALALVFFSIGAQAMWARYSDEDLIKTSGLIVVGTLTGTAGWVRPSDGRERTVGIIEIETLLKGAQGTKIARIDLPQPGMPIKSTDIHYRIGQQGLWFLRLLKPEGDAVYAADHPQRFVPYAQAGPQIKALGKRLQR